jgi:hypothetical protein
MTPSLPMNFMQILIRPMVANPAKYHNFGDVFVADFETRQGTLKLLARW